MFVYIYSSLYYMIQNDTKIHPRKRATANIKNYIIIGDQHNL